LPHPAEAWAMRLHGLAGFAALFLLGALAAAHIPQGWRVSGRLRWAGQRQSGLALCFLGAALVLSGYLLYYFAPEAVRPTLGWAHAGAGLAMAGVWVAHRRRAP
jgi:succinate dehydrogenase/fumarate reductase cytochrome b subunit